nr:hypothetical protein [Tanacetum cinerariifolium]
MVGASVVIGGIGIDDVVCYTIEMVGVTCSGERAMETGVLVGISGIGGRGVVFDITDTGTLSTNGDWIVEFLVGYEHPSKSLFLLLQNPLSASKIHKIKKEQAKKQNMPKYTIKSTDKATLKEYDLKSALYQTMNENKSFNKNLANHALYHAFIEALIEGKNAMDKGVADIV